ncbi:MAG: PIG-L family deacetylase [Acidobacteria bacterium]|nr:PIG-L family deacetylase [Acidobacteriota bacterium]
MKLLLALLLAVPVFAQTPYDTSIQPSVVALEIPPNRGSTALWQSLKKLHTRASLIMITAHPDDEDGGMLAYESRGKGTRVTLLTLNRGEGGANVMSPDYFDALGLVRTEELLAADRYYGVEQYWTRVVDYGFSKTMAESINHWTRDRVLADVVRVVRMVRPLVITSVFVGGPSDGHGNHQTAGAMAQAVFRAAGDPNIFPEQIREGLRPWSPIKDYARAPFFARAGGAPLTVNVEVPQGSYDPMLGASYVQISRQGLGYQKSQNGGPNIPKAGQVSSTYHRYASTVSVPEKEKDFFDGIDTSLMGLVGLAKGGDSAFLADGLRRINAAVEDATAKFSGTAPERSAPALAQGMKDTIALIAAVKKSSFSDDSKYDLLHELNIKRTQFNSALAQSLGLSVAASVAPDQEPNPRMAQFLGDPETFRVAIPGQTFGVRVHAVNQGTTPAVLEKLSVVSTNGPAWTVTPAAAAERTEDAAAKPVDARFTVKVPDNVAFTRPYFTRPDIEQSYYDITDARYLNQPLAPYPIAAWADWSFDGAPIRIGQYVQTVKRVNGLGTVLEPLVVAPTIGISISPRFGIVPLDAKTFAVKTVVHSNVKGPASGTVRLDLPTGWKSEPTSIPFSTTQDGEDLALSFTVTPANLSEKPYSITAVAEFGGRQYREGYEVTGYSGLRPYFLYTSSTYKTSGVDVKVASGLRVGYVMGSGDDVPDSLEHLGIKVSFLAPADIASGDLSRYDVILLGVRTYAARPELATYNNRLLDYVKNGGVVIVQYNTPEFDHNFGPYPYTMTSNPEEVTDEASKVQILAPSNPVFKWPNRISEKDFTGWVEERGSKWMKSWDPHYEALLETHDEGQEPQKGGLLYARYGKGIYVYNAYAFYRELPEGVPGAYRIFANLISLPKNPQR